MTLASSHPSNEEFFKRRGEGGGAQSTSFADFACFAVAVEMESGVVQLIVEHVCISMATHSQCARVALWAAKALANSSSNGMSLI